MALQKAIRHTPTSTQPIQEKRVTRRAFFTRELPEVWKRLSPTQRTAIETVFLYIGENLANKWVNRKLVHEIEEANKQKTKASVFEKTAVILGTSTVTPLVEEFLFRSFPSNIIDQYLPHESGKPTWRFGIPISLLFAAVHIPNGKNYSNRFIPVSQFIGSCYYWYLQRTRPGHNVLAHGEFNLLNGISTWDKR